MEQLEVTEDQLKHNHALEVAQLKLAQADEGREEREEELLLQVAQLSDEKEGLVDKVRWRAKNIVGKCILSTVGGSCLLFHSVARTTN